MSDKRDRSQTGGTYRCRQCSFEVHVTSGCDCNNGSTKPQCCGEPLEKVTAASVQNA